MLLYLLFCLADLFGLGYMVWCEFCCLLFAACCLVLSLVFAWFIVRISLFSMTGLLLLIVLLFGFIRLLLLVCVCMFVYL